MRSAGIGILLMAAAACSSPYRMYPGPEKERAEVVWIKPTELQIHSVDDRKVELEAQIDRDPIEILPGKHKVRLEWNYHASAAVGLPGYPSTPGTVKDREGVVQRAKRYYKDIEIVVKPGETYEAVWLPVEGQEQREPGLKKVKG